LVAAPLAPLRPSAVKKNPLSSPFSARMNGLLKKSPMMSFRSPALFGGLRNLLLFSVRQIQQQIPRSHGTPGQAARNDSQK